MKTIFFHMQGYRDLPDDFHKKYESVWVTLPSDELCDPRMVQKYLNWNIDELELADELGFDGLGVNEHHQNAYGFPVAPNLIASILARRKSDAAIVILGNTIPLYNPPLRVAEEYALIDCLSGGRLVAGLPVGSPPDTVGNYGLPPSQVRERYYEAWRLIVEAWTRKGPFPFNGRFTKLRYVNPWPKPIQKPHPPIYFSGLKDPKRSARRIAKYGLSGWTGIQDSPEEITRWRGEIERELGEMGRTLPEGFDMCSMIWFVITDEDVDQTPAGKASNLLVGSAQQIEDILKRYQEAGMTMPLLWPPFRDVPTAKTLDDLKRLAEEIMPKVNAA